MSRWLESDKYGAYHEELADMDECRHLINEVCTNPDSDQCCDFPHPEYCMHCCPHFTAEDGALADLDAACK